MVHPPTSHQPPATNRQKMAQRDRILIIDDQENNRLVIEDFLRRLRCEMRGVDSGEDGRVLLKEWTPDLIIVDQMMPGLSGVETTERIKALPDFSQVPVLMVTAKNDTETLRDAFDAGAVDYILKPVDQVTLTARVRSALRTKHAFDEISRLSRDLMAQKQELSNFTHMVSHDLKSPIAGAASLYDLFLYRLKDEYPGVWGEEGFRELLERIPATFRKMLRFIDTLLGYAEAGKVIGELERVSIGNVAQLVVANFEYAANEGLAVINCAPDLPQVLCDPVRFAQVWQNLIANAIKHRGARTPVHIKLGWKSATPNLQFWVQDNGPGIAAEDQERVFQPFARGESSEGGNGIGLATVQRILNAHRGRVWVAPDFTAGTRICFEIPDHVG